MGDNSQPADTKSALERAQDAIVVVERLAASLNELPKGYPTADAFGDAVIESVKVGIDTAAMYALVSIAESLHVLAAHTPHDFGWDGESEQVVCSQCGTVQP